MVFSSVEFLFLFLPLFLLAQNFLPWRNLSFVLFSLVFYFAGEGWFTAVVAVSVAINYVFGLRIGDAADPRKRKQLLAVSVALNLALLIFFKYAGFIADTLFHPAKDSIWMNIHLPLGISFFTFHAISYLVDIYRRDARAERSFVNLSLYMLMFPQLIAGPILRFHMVAGQLRRRVVTSRHVYYGLLLFCFGLGQKVLLADTMAGVADPLFARADTLSTQTAWLAAICYTLQIFFDFGGYSNMAMGLGWMAGFHFPRNFNFPYIARSITDFWRRWHMSLSRWFRDYLYIPLGGNRLGPLKTYRNLMIVFLLCGLWHGAAWTFVLWGAYHGLLLVLERLGWEKLLQKSPRLLQHGYTMLAVIVGWVLFRAASVEQAGQILAKMFLLRTAEDLTIRQILNGEEMVVLVVAIALSAPLVPALLRRLVALPGLRPWPRRVPAWQYSAGVVLGLSILLGAALKILTGAYSPFIYFRF
ncbi:MBOAT family O-acyltransferase [Tahibacter harae]|uniref:Probable alginate O-acetylase n=1 Tax=Tahibacter harae TaxID=2963937 RepID=A0ABT1QYL7_9GAMM|nr:MBOAT family protein [Tahibacter harae]MCQ4167376.1 MBOAT family protein [Tahibacter harae]